MNPDYKAIADELRGMTIISAPCCCKDTHEFMRGARDQANNFIYALCDVFAARDSAFDKQAFIKNCSL